jgi:hypothetical protein
VAGGGRASTGRAGGRGLRPLPLAATGQPAPFRVGAPAYLAALAGWGAAGVLLVLAAPELARLSLSGARPVGAAHAVGLVFFPYAVVAAVWQLLPVMLRNDPPRPALRPLVLGLLAAGPLLAAALALGRDRLAAAASVGLAAGLALLLLEVASLVRGAPAGRTLVVSRPAVALAGAHAAAAFGLGAAVLASGGPEPLGVPYERLLLIHVALALVGWLTLLIAAVGRTLVPMLGLATAPPPRSVPWPELVVAAGLWTAIAGLASSCDGAVAAGVVVLSAGLAAPVRTFARVVRSGRIGVREGPVAHVAVGLAFLLQAAVLALAGAADVVDGRRAAVAVVLLLGLGWAVGVILGHLGKLLSLSGWGSWPPGPRPRQRDLYPRAGWLAEAAVFAAGAQLLVLGVLATSSALARGGAVLLVVSAAVALASALETVRRVTAGRARPPASTP